MDKQVLEKINVYIEGLIDNLGYKPLTPISSNESDFKDSFKPLPKFNINQAKRYPVIEVPQSDYRVWLGGAFTMVFIYSNKGNFILKGYSREVNEVMEHLKKIGFRFIFNKTFFGGGTKRNFWGTSCKKTMLEKNRYGGKQSSGFTLRKYGKTEKLEFRRLPKRWIKEFDDFMYEK